MQVKLIKDKKGEVAYTIASNSKANGVLRVFIEDHRPNGEPRPGMKNILADFAWRRTVTLADIKKDPTFHKVIAEYLKCPVEELTFHFNRNAGCAMCPCSPGIVVKSTERYNGSHAKQIWADIFSNEQNPEELLAKEEAEALAKRAALFAKKAAEAAEKVIAFAH